MFKNKKEIILYYEESINRVNRLRKVSEEEWRTPVDTDKWTIAEIIGHLIPWDEFVLNERIPYMCQAKPLPLAPDVKLINSQASIASQTRSKDVTIQLFIDARQRLIQTLQDVPDELWTQEFIIGGNTKSLISYLSELIEHDLHHFKQIQQVN